MDYNNCMFTHHAFLNNRALKRVAPHSQHATQGQLYILLSSAEVVQTSRPWSSSCSFVQSQSSKVDKKSHGVGDFPMLNQSEFCSRWWVSASLTPTPLVLSLITSTNSWPYSWFRTFKLQKFFLQFSRSSWFHCVGFTRWLLVSLFVFCFSSSQEASFLWAYPISLLLCRAPRSPYSFLYLSLYSYWYSPSSSTCWVI